MEIEHVIQSPPKPSNIKDAEWKSQYLESVRQKNLYIKTVHDENTKANEYNNNNSLPLGAQYNNNNIPVNAKPLSPYAKSFRPTSPNANSFRPMSPNAKPFTPLSPNAKPFRQWEKTPKTDEKAAQGTATLDFTNYFESDEDVEPKNLGLCSPNGKRYKQSSPISDTIYYVRPGASSKLFNSPDANASGEESQKKKSKHYSKPVVQPLADKRQRWKIRTKNYSDADFYFNSFFFAKEKLDQLSNMEDLQRPIIPLPKRMRFRGRRALKRLIQSALNKDKEEVILHASYWGDTDANKDNSIIVDSGTTTHIARDREDFSAISNEQVRIRGVAGRSVGFKGILKESELGCNIPAIYFEALPVRMLLSLINLGQDGWYSEWNHPTNGNRSTDLRTGKVVPIVIKNGLPCYELTFVDECLDNESGLYQSAFVTQTVENNQEWYDECHYCDEPVPRYMEAAVVDTKNRKRSRDGKQKKRDKISKLLVHQRMCHMFTDATQRCRCFDCIEYKGRKASHSKSREQQYETDGPFVLFSCDFFGQIKPKSFRGNSWCLVYCCDKCGYTKAQPLERKSDAPASLVQFVNEVRRNCGVEKGCRATADKRLVFAGIHSDNEPVLRSELWRRAVQESGLNELHSVPYCPQMNGTCERQVGTIKSALRTTMHNVDPRVWDFCVEHISTIINLKNSKKATKCAKKGTTKPCCPDDIMAEVSSNPFFKSGKQKVKYLRRFGCLAYFKRDVGQLGTEHLKSTALAPRRVKGIHLGFSQKNSCWLIGTINSAGKLAVYETIDVVFVESILVRNIRLLCEQDISVPVVCTDGSILGLPSLGNANPFVKDVESGQSLEVDQPAGISAQVDSQGRDSAHRGLGEENVKPSVEEILLGGGSEEDHLDDLFIESDVEETTSTGHPYSVNNPTDRVEGIDNTGIMPDLNSELVAEFEIKPEPNSSRKVGRPKTIDEALDGATFGPPVQTKKRRGRPAGSKDRTRRTRRTGKQIQTQSLDRCFWQREDTINSFKSETLPEEYCHLASAEDDVDESTEFEIFLAKVPKKRSGSARADAFRPSKPGESVKPTWAFNPDNPERPSWVEAKDKEATTILAYESWRKLSPQEEKDWREGRLKAVPCALILNRKRCGRYKARLVVLGNRWHPDEENSVYASVVSQTGNRAVMTHCAREGFHIIPFDISNAFIRAEMGDLRVAVRLPESFREGADDNGTRMLLKALYGLPISPRLWAKTLAKDLTALGWEECKSEPGVYRKFDKQRKEVVAYITVYVDDCIVGAKNPELCESEVNAISAKHPLKLIESNMDAQGTMHFDMCGADIDYNSREHTLKISMAAYIDKIIERFNMKGCTPRPIPGFPEENLYIKSIASDFKFRAAVGALQWLATTARPDIAHSTNVLARAGAQPVTKSMQKCARFVFRYLQGTREIGLEYSPQIEKEFNEVYGALVGHEDNKKMPIEQVDKPVSLFTDASFGVVYKTLRSITGVCVYLHGMPIAWKTKVQTLHTSSTTEAEWVALADGIEFSQSVYGLQRFLVGGSELGENEGQILCDNRSAVISGRKGLDGLEEIPKKTRHIALRYARVLEHAKRLWFVPTDIQLADGLTKSAQRNPLLQNFTRKPTNTPLYSEEEMEQDLDFSDCFFTTMHKDLVSFDAFLLHNKVYQQHGTWFE